VIGDEGAVAFLFSHRRQLDDNACSLDAALTDCIVPIGLVEAISGLDYMSHLPRAIEQSIELAGGVDLWVEWQSRVDH